jgi:hypothetical protein
MSDKPSNEEQYPELTESERLRIRAEMRYALVAAQESKPPEKAKPMYEKALGFLSNGFVLLIVGALITSVLVPHFQRNYEQRKQQLGLMQECLGQFLLYSNSIWQEYYAILPLTQEQEIDKAMYVKYMNDIAQIKLKRYDAFAKVQALAVVFRQNGKSKNTPVDVSLKKYAIELNTASAAIDKWLRGLYCTPSTREDSPCSEFDPTFDPFSEYEEIKDLVIKIGNEDSDNVAELMVQKINKLNNGGSDASN